MNISIWVDVCVSDYTNQDIDDFHVDQEKHIKGVISEAVLSLSTLVSEVVR